MSKEDLSLDLRTKDRSISNFTQRQGSQPHLVCSGQDDSLMGLSAKVEVVDRFDSERYL